MKPALKARPVDYSEHIAWLRKQIASRVAEGRHDRARPLRLELAEALEKQRALEKANA